MGRSVGFRTITVTIATAGTAVQVTSAAIFTPKFELHVPSGNTGSVFIGNEDVDNTWIGRNKASAADDEDGTYVFTASENASLMDGEVFDLRKIYLDADTSADTAIIQYLSAEG